MSSSLMIAPTDGGYNERQMAIIRDQIAKGASDDELAYFLEVCRLTGLNPLQKQIYAIKRWSDGAQRMTIQTGIDGYRAMAARTGALAGIDDAIYDTEDGKHPGRASVTVWRFVSGHRVSFTATARWGEYVQTTKSGEPTSMWAKMPWLMLGKCAESLALRKAFPAELSGVYTAEEMAQAETPEHEPEPPAPKQLTARRPAKAEPVATVVEEEPAGPFDHLSDDQLARDSRALAADLGITGQDYAKAFAAEVNDGRPIIAADITRTQRERWYAHLQDVRERRAKILAETALADWTPETPEAGEDTPLSFAEGEIAHDLRDLPAGRQAS